MSRPVAVPEAVAPNTAPSPATIEVHECVRLCPAITFKEGRSAGRPPHLPHIIEQLPRSLPFDREGWFVPPNFEGNIVQRKFELA